MGILHAVIFTKYIIFPGSNHINASSPEDVGRAAVYEHNVTKACVAGFAKPVGDFNLYFNVILIHVTELAAPAWFKPVQVQLNNMQDKFENMCQWVEIQRSHLYFQADRKGNRD